MNKRFFLRRIKVGSKRIRRAFTITEVVVAMSIVVLLSAIGITSCMLAAKLQSNAMRSLEVCNLCGEFVAAFREVAGTDAVGEEAFSDYSDRLVFLVRDETKLTEKSDGFVYDDGTVRIVAAFESDMQSVEVTGYLAGKGDAICRMTWSVFSQTPGGGSA